MGEQGGTDAGAAAERSSSGDHAGGSLASGGQGGDGRQAPGAGGGDPGGAEGGDQSGTAGGGGSAPHVDPDLTSERVARVRYPWPRRFLSVCFRDQGVPDAAEQARRDALRQRVSSTVNAQWARYSALDFYGFETCEDHRDLEVELSATAPSHSEIGFPGIWTPRVITLNTLSSDAEVLYWFGRALGFEHERGRAADYEPCVRCESAASCTDPRQPECLPSGFCGRAADHESILAAPSCAGVESTRRLSAWDIVALQRAYGRKHAGALVETGGRCLQVSGGSSALGTAIDAYLCLASFAHNSWMIAESPTVGDISSLEVSIDAERRCAEVVDGPSPGGTPAIVSERCDAEREPQRVELGPLRLRSFGGQCVTATSATVGAQLYVDDCSRIDGTGQQLARFSMGQGQIRLADSGLCVAASEAAGLGDPLELRDCVSGASQRFALRGGEIQSLATGLCWDVLGGVPVPGAKLGLWSGCGLGIENNLFFATAQIRFGQRCLAALDEPGPASRPVGVAPCAESAPQYWDVYW